MKNDKYINRKFVIATMVIVTIVVYLVQLFFLQVVNHDKYVSIAGNNALLKKTIFPSRGSLYDRNGKLLVYNRAAYDVMITMHDVKPFDTIDFCKTVNITPQKLRETIKGIIWEDEQKRIKKRSYSPFVPQVLIAQLSEEENGALQEKLYKFPGFELRNHMLREYAYPNAAHIVGSIGEVSQATIDKDEDKYYASGDYAGQSGVEYSYENKLRGEKGLNVFLRDSRGRIKGKYEEGEYDKIPQSGENLTLSIDILLQAYGEKLMKGKRGSIVAIEPETGEVLAMVTNPNFNPSDLVGRKRSENYSKLQKNPLKPLINRATSGYYSPGSTFKPLQALVCLQENGINNNTMYPCSGTLSTPIKCTHSHGSPVTLLNAVEQSCNPYFWHAFRSSLEQDGYGEGNEKFKKRYDKWREDVMSFGYGQIFDSDISGQTPGNIPTIADFNKKFGAKGWRALTIRSLAIGQGEISCTPLQMANLSAIIANRGYYYTPHLVRSDEERFNTKNFTTVDSVHFDVVVEGMWRVCEYGTGRHYKIKDVSMCGKTGTVQNNHGKDHSLFIGFAPKDNPKIAIAVVVENAGFGATWANPIASLMMEMYLNGEIAPNRKYIEDRMVNANFINENAQ